jgi:hypothetical protein
MYLSTSTLRRVVFFLVLILIGITIETLVVQSAGFARNPDLVSVGVMADLLVGIPVLYYCLIVRRLRVSPWSLITVFGLAAGLTTLILPGTDQPVVDLLRWALPLAEFCFLGFLLTRASAVIRQYRQLNETTNDFMANLLISLDTVLGQSPVNHVLVSELSVLRYSLFSWFFPVEKHTDDRVFTTYRNSGQVALTSCLLIVACIEMIVVHLLLAKWHTGGIWLVTFFELYTLLFLIGDLMATIKRPVLIQNDVIRLRFGLRGYGSVPKQQIGNILPINDKPERAADTMNGSFLSVPNVLVSLIEPVRITGPLGIQKRVSKIAFFVDDRQAFIEALTA